MDSSAYRESAPHQAYGVFPRIAWRRRKVAHIRRPRGDASRLPSAPRVLLSLALYTVSTMTKVLNTEQLAASQLAMDVESKPEEEHYDMAIKPETQQTATLAGISEELQWAASLSDEELKAAQKKLVRKVSFCFVLLVCQWTEEPD